MGDRSGQQGSQVFYDPEMGQYYTQNTQSNPVQSMFGMLNYGMPNAGIGDLFNNMTGNPLITSNRNYLNNFGQSNQSNNNPYNPYGNPATLEQMLANNRSNQLLGLNTSSGAGRFISGDPLDQYLTKMQSPNNNFMFNASQQNGSPIANYVAPTTGSSK